MPRLTLRNRALGSRRALVVAALLAVLLPVAGAGSASGGDDRGADVPRQAAGHRDGRGPSGSFELLQMNLCLSGLAGCFDGTEYPNVIDEAIAKIDEVRPDAVTFNEACSGDVADIAAATGYHVRFATVIYRGEPLPCVDPGDRGVFGNAVITDAPIRRSEDAAFTTQSGPEERRWICATTTERVSVCATHLSTRGGTDGPATNDAQCAELTDVLRRYGRRGPTIFAGDVNRDPSCAPDGSWTVTDAGAEQLPGIQHAYGTERWFGAPRAEIHPATYTDHDFLLVTADERGGRGPHRRFDLQAHRGGVGLTTESTLAGFAKAIELGVTTLELDTQVTEDGKVVITHDRQISAEKCRDTEPAFEGDPEFPYVGKYITNLTLDQVQTVYCGYQALPSYPDQEVVGGPMIELSDLFDLVEEYRANRLVLNIETKVEAGAPEETAPRDVFVRRVWEEIRDAGMRRQVTIQSFDWGALMEMHELAPRLPLVALTNHDFLEVGQPGASPWLGGIDVDDFGGDFVVAAASIEGVTALSPVQGFPQGGKISDPDFVSYPDQRMINDAHARGLKVIPWTINDAETMDHFIDLGVDGIITDYPDVLRQVMADNGLPLPKPY